MFDAMKLRLQESSSAMLSATSEKLVEIVPQIVLALIILVVGIVLARLARKIVRHFADFIGLDKLAAKVNIDRALRSIGLSGSITSVLVLLVYWLLILFFFVLATDALGLESVSDAIGSIVGYIPHLIAALIIVVIGLLVGQFLRDVVSNSLSRAGIAASTVLGYIVQTIIIIFVCVLALGQIGLDVSLITTHMAIVVGVLLVTMGIALAIAARPLLENMLICRQVKQHLKIGDHVHFEGVDGEVVSFSLTSVIIRHGEKDFILPARQLFEQRYERKRSDA